MIKSYKDDKIGLLRLDFTGEHSAFGTGLPPWGKNHANWELMKPLLREESLVPTQEMAPWFWTAHTWFLTHL